MIRYNVTPSAAYQYAPAYKRYGSKINVVHFIGKSKPWSNLLYRPAGISNIKGKGDVFDCELPFTCPFALEVALRDIADSQTPR
jgi:hypothetical protein